MEIKMKTDQLAVGILAHVDSGKTTLAESILYISGAIRKLGRVDHKDAFLDTYALEKNRGITIFSKQARFQLEDKEITLLDTPGHVDFSAEMERTLQVLDYAILVINGADGVQGHTVTLWKLLKRYQVPVFIFVNKMDQPGTDQEKILEELQKKLDSNCIDFNSHNTETLYDSIAMCSENLMEEYLDTGKISRQAIDQAILNRQMFPCLFGSALKMDGVKELLEFINEHMICREYPEEFGARVFKIVRDEQDNRLTYMKITGGSLKVKAMLTDYQEGMDPSECWQEKADQIRLYSGGTYNTVNEVTAGTVCAVTGLSKTFCGEGLGIETESEQPVLEPVLTYRVMLPQDCNVHDMFLKLCQLEEEEPQLHIVWDESLSEIHAQVMGEVQIEILKSLIAERFHTEVEFGTGNIVYKETITEPVIGIGHFEPLRHYAEVHLLLEPLERGSGLEFVTNCSEDELDRNWQRLVLTHLEERRHKGVLTGSEITDMRITLIAGRAHTKHTEGGDFRQATYRAVRQGLKSANSILLEPVYEFQLEIPQEQVGRAMSDIQRRYGTFKPPVIEGDMAYITGTAPVVTMRDYQMEVTSYTRGHGRFSCTLKGYEPCHNEEEVLAEFAYDSEADTENPTGSVFCSHGAGFLVSWDRVPEYAHIGIQKGDDEEPEEELRVKKPSFTYENGVIDQEEIDEIFARTFGAAKQKRNSWTRTIKASDDSNYKGTQPVYVSGGEEYLLVDGYNIIFAWQELNELAQHNIDSARDKLMDIMCNYQGAKKVNLILVFDAYKVSGGQGEVFDYHNIHVVYTKEAETADQYIEKVTHELSRKYQVTVATSDRLEQMIIWGAGARRISAPGFYEEVMNTIQEVRENIEREKPKNKNYLKDNLSRETYEELEKIKQNLQ